MRAAKIDANQNEIVEFLRKQGATVQILSTVGKGCPDLLIGFNGKNLLMEIKDGKKTISQTKLTKAQVKWCLEWKGDVDIVFSIEDAQRVLSGYL